MDWLSFVSKEEKVLRKKFISSVYLFTENIRNMRSQIRVDLVTSDMNSKQQIRFKVSISSQRQLGTVPRVKAEHLHLAQ